MKSTSTPPANDTHEDAANTLKVSPLTGGALHLAPDHIPTPPAPEAANHAQTHPTQEESAQQTVLVTHYSATTTRMLRVSVNGFFESLGVVLGCMRELDGEDGWKGEWIGEEGLGAGSDVGELKKVQGLDEGGLLGVA